MAALWQTADYFYRVYYLQVQLTIGITPEVVRLFSCASNLGIPQNDCQIELDHDRNTPFTVCALRPRFELRLTESESVVLPLHYQRILLALEYTRFAR